jgi:hypothetical protein
VDLTALEGFGVVIAAIVVFCGSIWLLLSMVIGRRLAVFIVASIVVGMIFILACVWSLNPLGPVGQLPSWAPLAIAKSASQVSFQPAQQYPNGAWKAPDTTDPTQSNEASLLQTAATDYLGTAINTGKINTFTSTADAIADLKSIRLLQQGNTQYGAITFRAAPGKKGGPAVAVLSFNPGNPLGVARRIAVAAGLVFLILLFGLSRVERQALEPQPA